MRPRIQPGRELRASKFKSMKAKSLSFAFVYFSESGLFNALRAIQIRKFGLLSQVARQTSQPRRACSHRAQPHRKRASFPIIRQQ
jgi:hypothetical protein